MPRASQPIRVAVHDSLSQSTSATSLVLLKYSSPNLKKKTKKKDKPNTKKREIKKEKLPLNRYLWLG